MNQAVVVGRLTKDFELTEKDGTKMAKNTLAVPRPYKNKDGIYETDFINFTLFDNTAVNSAEYCKKGDLIGLKASLTTSDNQLRLNVEKVTFLATKHKTDDLEQEKDIKV